MLTNRATVQRLVKRLALRPVRAAGQNFLIDPTVAAASVAAANLTPADTVLEIGAGLGALTEQLAAQAGRVIAVERDRAMASFLTDHFARVSNVTVLAADIFRLRLADQVQDGQYKVVANLPYSSTSLVVRNFLTLTPRPSQLVLLIQKEVAERIVGDDANRSALTVLCQLASRPAIIRLVDRTSFWPAPEVTSAIIRLDVLPWQPNTEQIIRLARIAFAARRKQLKNSLAAGLKIRSSEAADLLQKAGFHPSVRPQELTADQWKKLYKFFVDTRAHP